MMFAPNLIIMQMMMEKYSEETAGCRALSLARSNDGSRLTKSIQTDKLMVYSYYVEHLDPSDLYDIVHIDRYMSNNVIRNMFPARSLEELQSYMRHLLEDITSLQWRVVQSKADEDYSPYLNSENGMVFSSTQKSLMSQDVTTGYAYCYLKPQQDHPDMRNEEEGDDDESEKADESRSSKNVPVHVIVASTWLPSEADRLCVAT
ncbi:hypothetical protein MBANPS3_005586 [Mucor bainieri]